MEMILGILLLQLLLEIMMRLVILLLVLGRLLLLEIMMLGMLGIMKIRMVQLVLMIQLPFSNYSTWVKAPNKTKHPAKLASPYGFGWHSNSH